MEKNLTNSNQSVLVQREKLHEGIELALNEAKRLGASQAEVASHAQQGLDVTVRQQAVDTLEFNRENGFGITVYFDHHKGSASTSDLSPEAIKAAVTAACDIAKVINEDKYVGLADKELLAFEAPDLDLYHPWGISAEQAIDLAKRCEAKGLSIDKAIANSEGASVSSSQTYRVYGNSNGLITGYPSTSHSLNCILVAKSNDGAMQRDYDWTAARDPHDLSDAEMIAENAAAKALMRLSPQSLATQSVPVIFVADVARSLFGHLLGAISGGNLYRQQSFLLDSFNQQVLAPHINITEQPHMPKGIASAPFDAEGVQNHHHDIIRDGVVQSYILSSYSARRLDMQTTGNAGGTHNVIVQPGKRAIGDLLQDMGKGLVIHELIGHGVNLVTGDYSRGAAGYWVENGEMQYPVEGITIAGNLRDMFLNIAEIADDVDQRGNIQTGSVLISKMMIAGQ